MEESQGKQRKVQFQNIGVSIHDYVLGIRHMIPYDDTLCLRSLRRFQGGASRGSRVICKETRRRVAYDKSLRSQGVSPGDILCVFP